MLAKAAVIAGMALALGSAGAKEPSPFTNQSKPMLATATMLALSVSSRQSFAGNQDVYLADLQLKDGTRRFVKLVDQYPGFGLPLRPSLLQSGTEFRVQVTREPDCDAHAATLAPASGLAAIYNVSVTATLADQSGNALPCYKTLHASFRVAKVR